MPRPHKAMDTVFVKYMDTRRKVFRTSKRVVPRGGNLKVEAEKTYVEDTTGRKTMSCSIQNMKHSEVKQYFTAQVIVQFADGVQTCCSKLRSGKPCSAYPHVILHGKGYCRRHKPRRDQPHSARQSGSQQQSKLHQR